MTRHLDLLIGVVCDFRIKQVDDDDENVCGRCGYEVLCNTEDRSTKYEGILFLLRAGSGCYELCRALWTSYEKFFLLMFQVGNKSIYKENDFMKNSFTQEQVFRQLGLLLDGEKCGRS